MTPTIRFRLAAVAALFLALYTSRFALLSNRFSNDWLTGAFGIEWLEWAPIAAFLVATVAAARSAARPAAVALVSGLIAFFAVQWHHVFDVPLGFLLACVLTLTALFLMPPEDAR